MNYIAHIHLANATSTSLVGNFLGDFVKGKQFMHLPEPIQHGIWLHRKVDSFTDQHHIIRGLKRSFPADIRRMAGVVLDIYFDHLLLRHWNRFCITPSDQLLADFYRRLAEFNWQVSAHFDSVQAGLLKHQWLLNYADIQHCTNAFYSVEKRLGYKLIFADNAREFLNANAFDIEQGFLTFYPQLVTHSQSIARKKHAST